jgi:hypothetical protein
MQQSRLTLQKATKVVEGKMYICLISRWKQLLHNSRLRTKMCELNLVVATLAVPVDDDIEHVRQHRVKESSNLIMDTIVKPLTLLAPIEFYISTTHKSLAASIRSVQFF